MALAMTVSGAAVLWSACTPIHGTPFSLATPIAPTTCCDEPVSTSAPALMCVLAASAANAVSPNEPVKETLTLTSGSVALTPARKPSTCSLASPASTGPTKPIILAVVSLAASTPVT